MLSQARIIFRKLRGSSSRGSRGSRGSEPASSAPAMTAESETVNPSPRAIHISDVRQSPTKLSFKPSSNSQSMFIIVANAKGTADSSLLYRPSSPLPHAACLPRLHVQCFIEGIVGRSSCRLREDAQPLQDGVLPFLATMIAAMCEGEGESEAAVSHAEAEAFATQRDCRFVKFSPTTGRDAVGSLVELAHRARDQYTMDQAGYTQRYKRAKAIQALFSS
ncbi:conserved hypothetical protein [Aspergillus udagawae]|uniref:Uncharacterized protein n=1 Tax=Aspergillus udagawae TaxID=91492 RepID=A0ABQ1B4E3_9EURO|nr:conserved hypothetical protein [Aspergillus udagawae]GFF93554.1 conserved hypothetical protein [Aspergillus udagawae]